jgi:osmotically-inducible protein OsmY
MKNNSLKCAALLSALILPLPALAATATDNSSSSSSMKESVKDAAITTKVKAELLKDKAVHATDIHVKTQNGVVTLSGGARSQAEADKAASIAKSVTNVASVQNDLEVGNAASDKNR